MKGREDNTDDNTDDRNRQGQHKTSTNMDRHGQDRQNY